MLHKAIRDFEDYLITDTGRVYSLKTFRYLRIYVNKQGYSEVRLNKQNKKYYKRVHRLVAEAFIENPENKPQVDHINRNKLDNRVENLRFVTSYENCENTENSHYKALVEKVNDEVSIGYLSINKVRRMNSKVLRCHISKRETHFKCKGREFFIAKEDL